MRRRTLLSASLGLGALVGAVGVPIGSGMTLYCGAALAFGTTVTIKVMHLDSRVALDAIDDALAVVQKIDALMSLHQERSQVFALNKYGFLHSPDRHLLFVLSVAQQLSVLTTGAFDITVQPLWRAFSLAQTRGLLPAPDEIAAAKSLVNWRQVDVQPHQVRLGSVGMGITLNGVAQGYAVDLALEALSAQGIEHALVDTGEHGAIGNKAPATPWMLGVAHPRQPDALSSRLTMDTRKVATSGDYATIFSSDYVHHHIFDPASGNSPPSLASVTVVAPTGIWADGLSTALMVMGGEKAFELVAQLPEVDIMVIDKNGRMKKTPNFPDA